MRGMLIVDICAGYSFTFDSSNMSVFVLLLRMYHRSDCVSNLRGTLSLSERFRQMR